MTKSNPDQAMLQALEHHQAGRLTHAVDLYTQILSHHPRHASALRLLGVIARQQGDFNTALKSIHQSIAIDPSSAEAHHNLGDVLQSLGDLDKAIAAYTHAIRLRPDWPEAHGALGDLLRKQGKPDQAVEEFKKVVQLNPAMPAGYLNLARTFHAQGKRGKAIAAYSTAIDLKPNWPDAHEGLGNVLWDEQRIDEAIAAYSRAVELHPGHLTANWSLGKILTLQGRLDEALLCFQRAADANPTNAKAHFFLAHTLQKLGRIDAASAAYREATRLSPDTPEWQFKLSALSGDRSIATAPTQYIRDLFEEYAPTFDAHLVEKLKYQAPEQLLQAVRATTSRQDLDILDLGCGTGLCGQKFRPCARRLVGVDLSPAMIQAAEARKIYDHLITGDLLPALCDAPASYDVIVAGDVLIYIGDLSPLMPAVARALRPGGLFACSIENYDGQGFFLHPEERFAHSISYLRNIASSNGLTEVSAEKVALRYNAGAEVPGWIVIFKFADPK